MTIQEFAKRTGFFPLEKYYHEVIERQYMASKADKDEFCEQWLKKNGIQKAYDSLVLLSARTKEELQDELNDCKVCLEQRNDQLAKKDAERQEMVIFLIEQAEEWSASELREKAIEMIGEKAYLRYKIEHNLNLWEDDRQLLIETLK